MADKISNEAIAAAALAVVIRDSAVCRELTIDDVADGLPAEDWQELWVFTLENSRALETVQPDPGFRVHTLATRLKGRPLAFRDKG